MKPALLLYCQHSVGIGHLMRSLLIAEALAARYRVVFLNGGVFPPGVRAPASVEIVDLPPLGLEARQLVSRGEEADVGQIQARRRDRVIELFDEVRPEVLLVELFPFGRKKFAFELLPLLRRARRAAMPCTILCSVRDILVSARPDQRRHDDRARGLCDRYFDGVLVHADPALAEFSASFRPSRPLATPVEYTGFVARPVARAADRGPHVLVSAGGGLAGGPLVRAAVAAHLTQPRSVRRPMRVIAGPFLPDGDWDALQAAARSCDDLEVRRSVPDLGAEMAAAAASVSQCGYNTAMDLLGAGVPALVVPFGDAREDEQANRARRLAELGLVRVLEASQLTPAALAEGIASLDAFRPAASTLALDGATRTADAVVRFHDLGRTDIAGGLRDVA